jgi:chemotaxis signal transduction protein
LGRTNPTHRQAVTVMEHGGRLNGLLVDGVEEINTVERAREQPGPGHSQSRSCAKMRQRIGHGAKPSGRGGKVVSLR